MQTYLVYNVDGTKAEIPWFRIKLLRACYSVWKAVIEAKETNLLNFSPCLVYSVSNFECLLYSEPSIVGGCDRIWNSEANVLLKRP